MQMADGEASASKKRAAAESANTRRPEPIAAQPDDLDDKDDDDDEVQIVSPDRGSSSSVIYIFNMTCSLIVSEFEEIPALSVVNSGGQACQCLRPRT